MDQVFLYIVLAAMAIVLIIDIVFSWIIMYHIQKYAINRLSYGAVSFVYITGSLFFIGFMVYSGISLIAQLQ
jgi:hypothetical protein